MECYGKTCRAATYRVRRLLATPLSWSWRRDSNPRPSVYKTDALPTELRQQFRGKDALSRKLIPLIPSRCQGQLVKLSQGGVGAQPRPREGSCSVWEFLGELKGSIRNRRISAGGFCLDYHHPCWPHAKSFPDRRRESIAGNVLNISLPIERRVVYVYLPRRSSGGS
jgi:hypothetical protein